MFAIKGGIRYGKSYLYSLNYTYPFARLKIDPEYLEITYPFGNVINLSRSLIKQIYVTGVIFFPGIRIIHMSHEIDPYLIFWTFKPAEVIEEFKKLEFPVEDNK